MTTEAYFGGYAAGKRFVKQRKLYEKMGELQTRKQLTILGSLVKIIEILWIKETCGQVLLVL
jgi:hypothetical protein